MTPVSQYQHFWGDFMSKSNNILLYNDLCDELLQKPTCPYMEANSTNMHRVGPAELDLPDLCRLAS